MTDPWLKVWLQGGPADDWSYFTLIEPPPTIYVLANPFETSRAEQPWVRVVGDWPDAIPYERAAAVEQFNGERIYYPAVPP